MRFQWLILSGVPAIVIMGLAVFLAEPFLSQGMRPFLAMLLPLVAIGVQIFLCNNIGVKVWVCRQWYRLWGPSAEVQLIGTISLDPESQSNDVLNQVKRAVRFWRDDAYIGTALDNKIIMLAGPRTLIVTLVSYGDDDDLDLVFELRGYQTKITTINDLLYDENRTSIRYDIGAMLNEQ